MGCLASLYVSWQCVLSDHLLLSASFHRCDTWTCPCGCSCAASGQICVRAWLDIRGRGRNLQPQAPPFFPNICIWIQLWKLHSLLKFKNYIWNGSLATKKPLRVLLGEARYWIPVGSQRCCGVDDQIGGPPGLRRQGQRELHFYLESYYWGSL